jgi:hypothetical protein
MKAVSMFAATVGFCSTLARLESTDGVPVKALSPDSFIADDHLVVADARTCRHGEA